MKCIGPLQALTVLGIELDSVEQVAHLPTDIFKATKELITAWLPRKWCKRRELESLHPAKVVWPSGLTYIAYEESSLHQKRVHPFQLN